LKETTMKTRTPPETPEDLKPLLGATLAEAEAAAQSAGYASRVISSDGRPHVATRDYRLDRINLWLVDGKVAAAFLG
jgi:hypothetical protein